MHSFLARSDVKRGVEARFGSRAARWYRLGYNLIGALTFLPVPVIIALYPGDLLYQLSGPALILALGGQFFALLLLIVGLFQTGASEFLGLRQLFVNDERSEPELVISGLYRWVRHPLYSAGLLFIWLTPVMTASVLALNVGLTIYIYIGSIHEERRLVREFGAKYEEYQRQVPRLFPVLPSSQD